MGELRIVSFPKNDSQKWKKRHRDDRWRLWQNDRMGKQTANFSKIQIFSIDKHVISFSATRMKGDYGKTGQKRKKHSTEQQETKSCPDYFKIWTSTNTSVRGLFKQTPQNWTRQQKRNWLMHENTHWQTNAQKWWSTNTSSRTPQKLPLRWGWLGWFVPNWTSILSTFHRQKLSNPGKFLPFLQFWSVGLHN